MSRVKEEEIAELYELSLGIGTSLDLNKNAQTFFESVAARKKLRHISFWHKKNNLYLLKEAYPEIKNKQHEISAKSPLHVYLNERLPDQVYCIMRTGTPYLHFIEDKVWVYRQDDIFILFLQEHEEPMFPSAVQFQLSPLYKKFILSIKASVSHRSLLDEVIKRHEAENKLFARESLFRFGANSLSEGIIVTNLEGKITYVNNAMSEITGFSREQLINSVAHEILKPEDGSDLSVLLNAGTRRQEGEAISEVEFKKMEQSY